MQINAFSSENIANVTTIATNDVIALSAFPTMTKRCRQQFFKGAVMQIEHDCGFRKYPESFALQLFIILP